MPESVEKVTLPSGSAVPNKVVSCTTAVTVTGTPYDTEVPGEKLSVVEVDAGVMVTVVDAWLLAAYVVSPS